jgi:hypothetical protein
LNAEAVTVRTLFVAAVAVLVVIGIDGWLYFRTLTPGALARSPTFNPLIVTTSAQASPISHYGDYLFVSDRAGPL